MKRIYFLVGILGFVPSVVNAETCVDFDDNGQFIEYDCGVTLTEERRQIVSEKNNIKRCGLENCEQQSIFLGMGLTTNVIDDTTGFTGEIGIRFRSLPSRWYYTLSVMAESIKADDTLYYTTSFYGGPNSFSLKTEKKSLNLSAGIGYYLTKSFDIYTKLTAGMYKAEVSGYQIIEDIVTINPENDFPFSFEYVPFAADPAKQMNFDFGVIMGANYNIYKCFNVFAEAQILPFGVKGTVKNETNAISREVNALIRIGVKVAF
ncbi:MAG: hypothetical protein NC311_00045 [Muribaculaceae bacterium]|nr:hypothetical protein [Muribaculaceae bacterium]